MTPYIEGLKPSFFNHFWGPKVGGAFKCFLYQPKGVHSFCQATLHSSQRFAEQQEAELRAQVGVHRWVGKGANDGEILLPRNLTWNLKMMVSKRNLLFQGLLFGFHVKFLGCNHHDIQKKCETNWVNPKGQIWSDF